MKKLCLFVLLALMLLGIVSSVSAGNLGRCENIRYVGWVGVVSGMSDHVLYPTENSCRDNLIDGLDVIEQYSPYIASQIWY